MFYAKKNGSVKMEMEDKMKGTHHEEKKDEDVEQIRKGKIERLGPDKDRGRMKKETEFWVLFTPLMLGGQVILWLAGSNSMVLLVLFGVVLVGSSVSKVKINQKKEVR